MCVRKKCTFIVLTPLDLSHRSTVNLNMGVGFKTQKSCKLYKRDVTPFRLRIQSKYIYYQGRSYGYDLPWRENRISRAFILSLSFYSRHHQRRV